MLPAQTTFDKFYMWPNYYFVSAEENKEFEDALNWMGDDFEIVYVYEYDEAYSPEKWLTEKEYESQKSKKIA